MAAKRAAPKAAPASLVISRAFITWVVSIVGSLLLALIAWWQVWDRVEVHWRLEAIQKARDDKIDSDIKAVAAKAEADLKAAIAEVKSDVAKYKEADRRAGAWTSYMLQDFRAAAEAKWAQDCVLQKRPADMCRELETKATDARSRANEQRASAMDASKGQP